MKPNFALTLSFEGISLLHRAFPGWKSVGEVSLDSPDLRGALTELRTQAEALESGTVQSKLVLPNDQIKYVSFESSERDSDTLAKLVREALDGATPYGVDDLAIDWSTNGNTIMVAAVARETLSEAEDFAAEYDFAPLCFVAIPEAGTYSGEPFFGISRFAASTFGDNVEIQRDGAPIRIIGSVVAAQTTSPEPTPEIKVEVEIDNESISIVDVEEPDVESVNVDESLEIIDVIEEKEEFDESEVEVKAELEVEVEVEDEPAIEAELEVEVEPEIEAEPEPEPGEQPIVLAVAQPETAVSTTATFASIRAQRREPSPPSPQPLSGAQRDSETLTAPHIPIEPADTLASTFTPVPAPARDVDAEATEDVVKPEKSGVAGFFSRRSSTAKPKPEPAAKTQIAPKPPAEDRPDAASEAQRMTVFGARKDDAVGGKPKHLGLVLTLVLLAFLAGVAAWASIFMDDGIAGFFGPRESVTAQLPLDAPDETEIEGEEAILPDAEATAALAREAEQSLTDSTDNAVFEALNQNEPTMDPDEAQALYAVSGIWQMAPQAPQTPGQTTLDDLYVASIDSAISQSDAVALPSIGEAVTDNDATRSSSPAAAGTQFALDGRGLVIATKGGALTPDGVLVFAGRPEIIPAAFPSREAETQNDQAVEIAEKSKLAEFRPKPRPDNLIEQNERSTLGGLSRQELAAFRPKLRPARIQPKIEEIIKEVVEADPVIDSQTEIETATAQAVASSRKPNARPRNFSRVVARAKKAEERVTQVAAVAPRTVTPSVPSRASVTKQATVRNAINLRKVNLIGVYGKTSSRRALVRMSNGRYKKVKVGDRIDGGKVAAIGDGELRYTKNGRNVILRMPKG